MRRTKGERAEAERRAYEALVMGGVVGSSVEELRRLVRPMPEAVLRAALKALVARGLVTVRKREGIKHLPWQKSVPIRFNVYHVDTLSKMEKATLRNSPSST